MAKETTLESLANLVTKGFVSADKKFAALAEDIAAVEKRLDKTDAKIESVESNLAGKIDHLDTKLTKFEESEIDKRKQLEVRVAAIEKHLGIDKKIAA
jgi:septal ring factor EnvC (AmiA/AmiB activator)